MRNSDISLIILNKNDYQEKFRKIVNNITLSSLQEIVDEMRSANENGKNEILIEGREVSFSDLYDSDISSSLEKQAFNEVAEKYKECRNDSTLRSQIDIDLLQPIMYYTSSQFFNNRYYSDLAYHPPFELSKVFSPFFKEYAKALPNLIEFTNPYNPLAVDIDQKGGIYHTILTPQLISRLYEELKNEKLYKLNAENIENDMLFLKQVFEDGIKGRLLIIMQVMS